VSECTSFSNDSSRGILKDMISVNGLIDVWRERNQEGRVFSRRQVVRVF